MALVVDVSSPEEVGALVVSSVEELEELLLKYVSGDKTVGGLYTIAGSFEISVAPAMAAAIEDLKAYGVHSSEKGQGAKKTIITMGKLDEHLLGIVQYVNLLLAIADGDKADLDSEAAKARAELEEEAARNNAAPPNINDERLLSKAKLARLRVLKDRSLPLKSLRAMSLKAHRRFKVGRELEKKLLAFHRRVVKMVAFVLKGERTMEWLIGALERLNEVDLPDLLDTPTKI